MKVRWTERSLRLRITPSELAALRRGDPVCAALGLPDHPGPVWRVVIDPAAPSTGVQGNHGGVILLDLGAADIARLSEPQIEGVYFRSGVEGTGSEFVYFVEKDFPCLHPRPADALEPHAETFAPPRGFAERKA